MVRHTFNRVTLGSRRVYAWLRYLGPDLVVISEGDIAGGIEWARVCCEAGLAYVIIVHCNSEFNWFDGSAIPDAISTYTNARNVFCVSRGNLELLRRQVGEFLPNSEIVWNPWNVSAERIVPWPSESKCVKLASVARLDPAAKGQDLLLQVLACQKWRDRPIELSFFGEGLYELALQRLAKMLQLDNVHFRGHVGDVQAIWRDHHILVLPSRYEGLPLVLVEAMWCGRPAIVTDVAGNAELCADGVTGFVASAPTPAAFDEALERAWVAREEWPRMGQAARCRVETLIPKDPIGVFCKRLISCISGTSEPVSPS
jgi:glycosyltransferase involved in cell wall biosynthesis